MLKQGEGLRAGQKLSAIITEANAGCPVCHRAVNPVLFREADRSFCVCKSCRLLYMQKNSSKNDPEYSEDYFGQEYRKQYGKTYLEDFESIKKQGQKRVNRLIGLGLAPGQKILDVGCAYGPFLSAASDAGLSPYGMDIASSAVLHVSDKLGFPAWCGNFLDFSREQLLVTDGFDALTFWYVLEHFPQLDIVLSKVKQLIKPGAFVAMAVPNAAGISAKKNRKRFLSQSPRDHYSLFTPKSLIHIMKTRGFNHRKTVVTGHHPERFPFYFKPLHAVYLFVSKVFGLGDTFEIYFARSINERQAQTGR
jgi:2-polyprenyl-3-methyl-5-hydroxy-6-metoxy-1,4-benzoquinol methylase